MTEFVSHSEFSYNWGLHGETMYFIKLNYNFNDYWELKNHFGLDFNLLRYNITHFLGVDGNTLTRHLRKEYHCLTQYEKRKYMFSSKDSCDRACEYLNTLLVARKLRG